MNSKLPVSTQKHKQSLPIVVTNKDPQDIYEYQYWPGTLWCVYEYQYCWSAGVSMNTSTDLEPSSVFMNISTDLEPSDVSMNTRIDLEPSDVFLWIPVLI